MIINHDVTLEHGTNVKQLFPDRSRKFTAPCVDGESDVVRGWPVHELDLEEIKTFDKLIFIYYYYYN